MLLVILFNQATVQKSSHKYSPSEYPVATKKKKRQKHTKKKNSAFVSTKV